MAYGVFFLPCTLRVCHVRAYPRSAVCSLPGEAILPGPHNHAVPPRPVTATIPTHAHLIRALKT